MKLRAILPVLVALAVAVLLFTPRDAAAADGFDADQLNSACLASILKGCDVVSSGYVGNRELDGQVAFQTQSGFTDDDGVLDGIVLFVQRDGDWHLLRAAFDGYDYTAPIITDWDNGIMLHSAGYSGGTGAYNVDLLYQRRDDVWHPIDIDTWLATAGNHLPAGLEIWKGVDYDIQDWFGGLQAHTWLWRGDDGNCCPTGGEADITFAIEDDALVVTSVVYVAPAKAK